MNAPRTTVWRIDEHTIGKHLLLREYLNAWIPILGTHHRRIVFVDGFAGPGEYAGGERGSPIIALDAFADHPHASRFRGEMVFIFIEQHAGRLANLRRLIGERTTPPNVRVHLYEGQFDQEMSELLAGVDGAGGRIAPTVVMIDPFGVKGIPMDLIARLFRHQHTEVLITFMVRDIARFTEHENFENHLDALFGCEDWRGLIDQPEDVRRVDGFYRLYEQQLRAAGAAHVIKLEMFRDSHLVYALFFATRHSYGCQKMKEAVWRVVPGGDYRFRGSSRGQVGLDLRADDTTALQDQLKSRYRGRDVPIEEIVEFVRGDETLFHENQLRKKSLKPMLLRGEIEAVPPPGRTIRRGDFPNGTVVRFLVS